MRSRKLRITSVPAAFPLPRTARLCTGQNVGSRLWRGQDAANSQSLRSSIMSRQPSSRAGENVLERKPSNSMEMVCPRPRPVTVTVIGPEYFAVAVARTASIKPRVIRGIAALPCVPKYMPGLRRTALDKLRSLSSSPAIERVVMRFLNLRTSQPERSKTDEKEADVVVEARGEVRMSGTHCSSLCRITGPQ